MRARNVSRRGSILVLASAVLVVILIFTAFVVDHGYIMVHKTRMQAGVDAAALAAAQSYEEGDDVVQQAVGSVLAANGYQAGDDRIVEVEYVKWNADKHKYKSSSYSEGNAVRVSTRFTGVPSFFGTLMGFTEYSVAAEAVALMTTTKPRDIVLVIDCSTSMEADMSNGKSRIENTRKAAAALIDNLRPEDRVGLAVYSWTDPSRSEWEHVERTGIVETQLDFDKKPTDERIDDLEDGEYGSGTNIGGGLRAGLDVFLQDAAPRPDGAEYEPILVLMTDGEVNLPEPYPYPGDGALGVLPDPPYDGSYGDEVSVSMWANTIKARGIKLHVVTLGSSAHSSLMVDAASPDDSDTAYYHHVADGGGDYSELLDVYTKIGAGNQKPKLVR